MPSTFNPFEHHDKLVLSNIFGGTIFGAPYADTVRWGDTVVPSAKPGHPETIQYWLWDDGLVPITQDEAFAQMLWLHYEFGAPLGEFTQSWLMDQLGLSTDYQVTQDELWGAVQSLPHIAEYVGVRGFDSDVVWAYVEAVAPFAI